MSGTPAARMGWPARAAGLALVLALGFVGCSAPSTPEPSEESTASTTLPPTPIPTPTPVPAERLTALKRAAGIAACPPSDPAAAAIADGLPAVTVPCLGGGRSVRLAGLRGRPLLINVWAQWCGPCREEAPALAEAARDAPSGLLILGIDYDDPEPDYAIEFARLSGWRYPQLADPDRTLAAPLRVAGGPPQTLFVTAAGRISYRHTGAFSSAEQIRSLARRHLGVEW